MLSKKAVKDALVFSGICVFCAITVMLIYYFDHNSNQKEPNVKEVVESCHLSQYQGDGFCDDEVNTPECSFDLGDCCNEETDKTLCSDCTCQAPENNYTLIRNVSYYHFQFTNAPLDGHDQALIWFDLELFTADAHN